ncbi:uroporphyrinogen-III synthase [Dietzia sp. ANT_WB102]|nr:uroporphyrinogen-III synthase [Dietzia sp. ANT_WB102]
MTQLPGYVAGARRPRIGGARSGELGAEAASGSRLGHHGGVSDDENADVSPGSHTDLPLRGRTVAVTAARRAEEQRTILERRGAQVLHAPAIRTIHLAEDQLVRAATERLLAAPADLMVLTTAAGVRWWLEICEVWGVRGNVLALMDQIPLYSRGPKVTGALRAAGLREYAAAASEASPELLEMLLARGVDGLTVGVQVQGTGSEWNPMGPLLDGLRAAGADLVELPIYRWELPENLDAIDELVRAVAACEVDGVTFTSAPAVVSVLERARATGVYDELLAALRGPVVALCVGPVTADPLVELGVPVSCPERMRLGALMRHATEVLSQRG